MEKRLQLEKRGRQPDQITELTLDNCRSTSVVGLTDEFVNLETLSLINVGLTSLKGFPKLPNLLKLELSDNRIVNGLNLLSSSPKLTHLNLSGNKIKDLEPLQPLKEFKNLKNLDLYNNDATLVDGYRTKVFNLIPSLQYLDGYDVNNKEADSEAEEDDVNGNEDDSEEEEVSTDEEEEDIDDDDVGLQAVYNENLEDDSDEGDYEAEEGEDEEEEDEEEEDDDEEDGEQESPARGKKRKHEDGEAN